MSILESKAFRLCGKKVRVYWCSLEHVGIKNKEFI